MNRLRLLLWALAGLGFSACQPDSADETTASEENGNTRVTDTTENQIHTRMSKTMVENAVRQNLNLLNISAQTYFASEGASEVTAQKLLDAGYIQRFPQPVLGEDYSELTFKASGGKHIIKCQGGLVLEITYH